MLNSSKLLQESVNCFDYLPHAAVLYLSMVLKFDHIPENTQRLWTGHHSPQSHRSNLCIIMDLFQT